MSPPVLWTGRLSREMALLVNAGNLMAWATGNARNARAMRERVRRGYDGEFSDHVARYDALGLALQLRTARLQLDGVDLGGKEVLDVGCGTGVLTFVALEEGASSVTCGDISSRMLRVAQEKAAAAGYPAGQVSFVELDAEALPFPAGHFDVAMTGMTFGHLPDQQAAVSELARVTRPGGLVCVGAHGPEHYWEAVDASFRVITKRRVLGYRIEFWPRTDAEVEAMLQRAGLTDTRTFRATWRNDFATGMQAFDLFAAITASWWYAAFPPKEVAAEAAKACAYFERAGVTRITDDVIFAYGSKAA
jgi:ubiquinone/menaquinone biosynthesis C-methylase UbiE